MALVGELKGVSHWQADSIRRTYIAKRGSTELRGLGIPTMRERAMQALARLVLEPEWEAKFEPNSYGFRKLYRWARFRHPRKTGGWSIKRYWKRKGERTNFGDGTAWLVKYADTPITRHIKVRGDKSPRACPEPFALGPQAQGLRVPGPC